MKRFLLTVVAILGLFTVSNAQSVFRGGDHSLNLGVGLNAGQKMYFPAISGSYEMGLVDNLFGNGNGSIGFGAYAGVVGYNHDHGMRSTHFLVGPRLALHYGFVGKLDTYFGIMLGYRNVTLNGTVGDGAKYVKADDSGFAYNGFLGARYFFNERFAAFLELGYGVTNLNAGISIRL